ncbi:glycosyltransferase family 2 protein [Microbacterium sp. SMR1]|uniref:glycosyltransferase family 2 protein n=1 Tax=Microbacterium sp. SMR1 TaxID=1497340 RepID=UPI0011BDB34F|nr:glycosyltransferase family 2 protein [Microbacterium sp. SMR1]
MSEKVDGTQIRAAHEAVTMSAAQHAEGVGPSIVAAIPTVGAVNPAETIATVRNLHAAGIDARVVLNARSVQHTLREIGQHLVLGDNRGFGASVAQAIADDHPDWVLIVNDDVAFEETSAQTVRAVLSRPTEGRSFKVVHFGHPTPRRVPNFLDVFLNFSLLGKILGLARRRGERASALNRYYSFDCVAVEGALWRELGGFDPNLTFTFEDVDFIRRAHDLSVPLTVTVEKVPGLTKNHSVSSRKHVTSVLPVSTYSALRYLQKWGHSPTAAKLVLRLALMTRAIMVILRRERVKNLKSIITASAALGTSVPPSLPSADSL